MTYNSEYSKDWYSQNRERILDRQRKSYAANKKEKLDKCQKYREEHKEQIKGYQKKYHSKARIARPWHKRILEAKYRSARKGLEFNLSDEWAESNYTGKCAITGMAFVMASTANPWSLSIDRIDPRLGYTEDNCRFVLMCVNAFKNTMTDKQMKTVARAILAP